MREFCNYERGYKGYLLKVFQIEDMERNWRYECRVYANGQYITDCRSINEAKQLIDNGEMLKAQAKIYEKRCFL